MITSLSVLFVLSAFSVSDSGFHIVDSQIPVFSGVGSSDGASDQQQAPERFDIFETASEHQSITSFLPIEEQNVNIPESFADSAADTQVQDLQRRNAHLERQVLELWQRLAIAGVNPELTTEPENLTNMDVNASVEEEQQSMSVEEEQPEPTAEPQETAEETLEEEGNDRSTAERIVDAENNSEQEEVPQEQDMGSSASSQDEIHRTDAEHFADLQMVLMRATIAPVLLAAPEAEKFCRKVGGVIECEVAPKAEHLIREGTCVIKKEVKHVAREVECVFNHEVAPVAEQIARDVTKFFRLF